MKSREYFRCFMLLMLLSACEETREQSERLVPARPVTSIISDTAVGTVQGAWQAVQAPIEDIGIKREPIPEKLQQLVENPYSSPPIVSCEELRAEIAELDSLLGPDICTAENPTAAPSRKGEYIEKGANVVRDQAVGMVSGKASIIPFRGLVRNISGAEQHARELEKAYEAGKLRRAFLKGLASTLGAACLNPPPPPQTE